MVNRAPPFCSLAKYHKHSLRKCKSLKTLSILSTEQAQIYEKKKTNFKKIQQHRNQASIEKKMNPQKLKSPGTDNQQSQERLKNSNK